MLEAGCKSKDWVYKNGYPVRYQWIADGELLEKGICIRNSYQKYFAPETGQTEIYSTIEYQKVRKVDAKEQIVSIDLSLTLKWKDPNILSDNAPEIIENGGIALRQGATEKIWTPDLFIWNSTALKPKDEWAKLKKAKVYRINAFNDDQSQRPTTVVMMKYEIKTKIYCDFHFKLYPMDEQNCSIKIGSGSEEGIFSLNDVNDTYHSLTRYTAVGLKMEIEFFGTQNSIPNRPIGFHITMTRLRQPFVMKYYIPSAAMVLVSEIGFVIPLTAIPGRVALLVTQFLTLVNLFIHQMVNNNCMLFIYNYSLHHELLMPDQCNNTSIFSVRKPFIIRYDYPGHLHFGVFGFCGSCDGGICVHSFA